MKISDLGQKIKFNSRWPKKNGVHNREYDGISKVVAA